MGRKAWRAGSAPGLRRRHPRGPVSSDHRTGRHVMATRLWIKLNWERLRNLDGDPPALQRRRVELLTNIADLVNTVTCSGCAQEDISCGRRGCYPPTRIEQLARERTLLDDTFLELEL